MSEKKELVTTKTLFDNIDALYDPEYENNFERYKETCFESWNWLETQEKRDEHARMMTAKMNEHDCNVKKGCKQCAEILIQLTKLRNAWRNGHYLLKFRYASSVPGLIQGVKYIGKDNWIIKTAYQLNMDKKASKENLMMLTRLSLCVHLVNLTLILCIISGKHSIKMRSMLAFSILR